MEKITLPFSILFCDKPPVNFIPIENPQPLRLDLEAAGCRQIDLHVVDGYTVSEDHLNQGSVTRFQGVHTEPAGYLNKEQQKGKDEDPQRFQEFFLIHEIGFYKASYSAETYHEIIFEQ